MKRIYGFTLVEMLMALLVISIILSASMPIITKRTKSQITQINTSEAFPIGGIIVWGTNKPLPDSTWLECNGQAIPNGIEYEQIRQIYGENLPDYRGVFLRGYGSITHTQNWTDVDNNSQSSTTTHTSSEVGVIQADTMRLIYGSFNSMGHPPWDVVTQGAFSDASHMGKGSRDGYETNVYAPNSTTTTIGAIRSLKNGKGFLSGWSYWLNSSRIAPSSNEVRPINVAVRYIIKVKL